MTGATGNVGSALLRRLTADESIREIVGISRRPPALELPRTRWVRADVAVDPLAAVMRGADAVVHLAWAIQPSRDARRLWATNVVGTERVIDATLSAGAPALIYASSVGAYSPAPKDRRVDESWPTEGPPTSFYGRHKAETERRLDDLERGGPALRVVRMRPGLIFSRRAASGQRRLFLGRLVPRALLAPSRIPLVPALERLRFQAVHSDDVAEAYHRALTRDVSGAFNVAAEPVIDADVLAEAFGARRLPVPSTAVRAAAWATWKARLQPTPPGWWDMGLSVPLMDCSRARDELGWRPSVASTDALVEVLRGMADGAGWPTPPLAPAVAGNLAD